MAVTLGDAVVYLAADNQRLQADLNDARGRTTAWASGVGDTMKSMLTGAVVGGAVILTTAVAGIGAAAWGMASDTQGATADVRAQFGLTAAEAERTAEIARRVWGNNFADSIGDAATAVGLVQQQLGELGTTSDREVEGAATDAIRLRDVYGVEIAQSVDAAATLMQNFGISSGLAFDFLASGYQRGLDRSGDFLESVGEYSTQFANAGADVGEFFSIMESGMAGGMLGTDKAADAFKEFRVRILDGSDATSEALAAIGIDAEEMIGKLASGEITVTDAWNAVIGKLGDVDDQAVLMQAGVGLIGTQFEDLGQDAVLAITTTGVSMREMVGAADTLDAKYNTLGSVVEGYKRRALLALAPISDLLLDVANRIAPRVETAFANIEAIVVPLFERGAQLIDQFFASIDDGATPLQAAIDLLMQFLPPDFLERLQRWLDILIPIGAALAGFAILTTVVGWITGLIAAVSAAGAAISAAGGIIAAIIAVLGGPLTIVLAVVAAAVGLLVAAWRGNWGDIQGKTEAVWTVLKGIFEQLRTWVVGTLIPTVQEWYQKWTEEWWPTIQTVLENAWTIIEEIFSELGRWIKDNLGPWVEHFHQKWTEEWWPAIQGAIESMWDVIRPIWESFREWLEEKLPPALEGLRTAFATAMGAIDSAIQPVKQLWDNFVAAIKGFWTWLTSHDFSINIELPDLPDWATPDSPIPLHTAWKNFAEDMQRLTITPRVDLSQAARLTSALALPTLSPATNRIQEDHYSLTINSAAPAERILDDFAMMRALAGSRRI